MQFALPTRTSLLVGTILVLCGCSTPQWRAGITGERIAQPASLVEAQFPDLPVSVDAQNFAEIQQKPDQVKGVVSVITYETTLATNAIKSFLTNEAERLGWEELFSYVEADGSVIAAYRKPKKYLNVRITELGNRRQVQCTVAQPAKPLVKLS